MRKLDRPSNRDQQAIRPVLTLQSGISSRRGKHPPSRDFLRTAQHLSDQPPHTFRGEDGAPDPLIMDERFVAACVVGRGVTVLSACSHAGVVNACLGAKKHFPNTPIDVVLGGYHLAGKAMETGIEPTIRDLKGRIEPRVVAPGHCTGWRAKVKLAQTFAPGRYAPSVVGTLYRLSALTS